MIRSDRQPRNSKTQSESDADSRSAQIDDVIADVARRRHAGVQVDDSSVTRAYPHLMLELGERLRTLHAIEEAAHCAEQEAGASAANDDPDIEP